MLTLMSPDRGRGDSPGRRLSMLPSAVWGKLEASAKEISTKTGTSRYMAPECFQVSEQMGNTYTNKVDVFSFAILSWELLARKRAYDDTYMTMDMVAKCVHENGMRPKLPTKWSDPIKTLLQRAWAQDPNDRPSFAELARELDALHKGAQERSSAKGTTVANELGLEDGAAGGCCGIM
jgi:serine/threonine protein kinase